MTQITQHNSFLYPVNTHNSLTNWTDITYKTETFTVHYWKMLISQMLGTVNRKSYLIQALITDLTTKNKIYSRLQKFHTLEHLIINQGIWNFTNQNLASYIPQNSLCGSLNQQHYSYLHITIKLITLNKYSYPTLTYFSQLLIYVLVLTFWLLYIRYVVQLCHRLYTITVGFYTQVFFFKYNLAGEIINTWPCCFQNSQTAINNFCYTPLIKLLNLVSRMLYITLNLANTAFCIIKELLFDFIWLIWICNIFYTTRNIYGQEHYLIFLHQKKDIKHTL